MSIIKSFAKDCLPPAIFWVLRQLRGDGIRFEGDYATWEDAAAQCTGYDAEPILAKVLDATLKVKRGEAAYERDSVLFDAIEYSWPVTAGLLWAAARSEGRLNVLDFGGSLGSSYFQNRKFLDQLINVQWSVVEQTHFVRAGKDFIQDDRLRFHFTIEESVSDSIPNIVLLSSVLQYIAEPYALLDDIVKVAPDCLIIDRTPFLNTNSTDKIKIQEIPAAIYKSSYPCWFFNFHTLADYISALDFELIEKFDALDKLDASATWHGLIFKKR